MFIKVNNFSILKCQSRIGTWHENSSFNRKDIFHSFSKISLNNVYGQPLVGHTCKTVSAIGPTVKIPDTESPVAVP